MDKVVNALIRVIRFFIVRYLLLDYQAARGIPRLTALAPMARPHEVDPVTIHYSMQSLVKTQQAAIP
jgi:hypothetical protein